MKIVNREEFLKLPANTVFSKFDPHVFCDLKIKDDSLKGFEDNYIDFYYTSISDSFDNTGSEDYNDKIEGMLENSNLDIPMDFNQCGRDGLFDKNQLFAVWSKEDVNKLIERLKECL